MARLTCLEPPPGAVGRISGDIGPLGWTVDSGGPGGAGHSAGGGQEASRPKYAGPTIKPKGATKMNNHPTQTPTCPPDQPVQARPPAEPAFPIQTLSGSAGPLLVQFSTLMSNHPDLVFPGDLRNAMTLRSEPLSFSFGGRYIDYDCNLT
jgi:hypothetical protein